MQKIHICAKIRRASSAKEAGPACAFILCAALCAAHACAVALCAARHSTALCNAARRAVRTIARQPHVSPQAAAGRRAAMPTVQCTKHPSLKNAHIESVRSREYSVQKSRCMKNQVCPLAFFLCNPLVFLLHGFQYDLSCGRVLRTTVNWDFFLNRLIQVVSTSEFHEYSQNDIDFIFC